jgi:hypothetical protein
MSNQFVLYTADISIDGATFAVLSIKHSKGGAIYRNVSGTQYKLIIHTPLDRESLPIQNYICPDLGSKTTVKLAVVFWRVLRFFDGLMGALLIARLIIYCIVKEPMWLRGDRIRSVFYEKCRIPMKSDADPI